MAVLHEYAWLVVVGALGAFGFGWGTGANDVANAFGTSIGSKALTLKQATIIAAIFEFTGALVLGRVSTNTIAGGIADITSFAREPEIYAYGMACALGVGTVWLAIASYMELNVSSTHSIIGGIIGFALVYDGSTGVNWAARDPGSFPPYKGVLPIVLSWFIAPLLSAAASALFFFLLRTFVLRRSNAFRLSFWVLPVLVLVVTWINVYFVFTKGAKKYLVSENDSWTDTKSTWISAIVAGGFALLAAVIGVPWLKRKVDAKIASENNRELESRAIGEGDIQSMAEREQGGGTQESDKPSFRQQGGITQESDKPSFLQRFSKAITYGVNVDVHQVIKVDPVVGQIHDSAEKFNPHVEYVFAYLQVFSAICVIFAHGAGEVGYMAGPLATIWDVYTNGNLSKTVTPQVWIILIGAIGLVIGLATYGYNVTRAMGVKLAKLSPTRGMCAELATAFIIMIGAQYMLPTSSSQCITGAIVGIGVMEGLSGVNWKVFLEQFASWVMTLVVIGLCTAAIFAQGVYSPSMVSGKDVMRYENDVTTLSTNIVKNFNSTLLSYQQASEQNLLTQLPFTRWKELNTTVNHLKTIDLEKVQTVDIEVVMGQLRDALLLVQQSTINTLGQNKVFPGVQLCNLNITSLLANETVGCQPPFLVQT